VAAGGGAATGAPTLTLIQGGAGAAGEGTAVAATGTEGVVVAGGASAAATVGAVLIGVAVVVVVGLTVYYIVTLEDPRVDPTIPDTLDEANDEVESILDQAEPPQVVAGPERLPEIGREPGQRRHPDQTCTNEVADALQEAVNHHCKELPRGCTEDDDCLTLRRNWFRNERCARARERMNERCWGGGNPGHQEAADAARRAEENCRELYRRKC